MAQYLKWWFGKCPYFESPGHFFGKLSEKRWEIVRAAQGKGELSVRELARTVGARCEARAMTTWLFRPDWVYRSARRGACGVPLLVHAH